MPEITTQAPEFGDSNNTLWLKIATALQNAGGEVLVPTTLVFSTQPAGAVAGEPFTTQPVVTVKDQNGATLTTYTGNVGVFLFPAGSELASDTITPTIVSGIYEMFSVAAVAGVATFPDLKITDAGDYQLGAHADNLVSAPNAFLSAVFTVMAAVWLLAGGTWSDSGIWVDAATWEDS